MTATDEKTPESGGTVASTGRVARVIGPVVDVEFPADQMPEIYFALHVDVSIDADTTRTLTLEVEQHIGDNIVRAISMQPTDGLVRGAEVSQHRRAHRGAGGRRDQGPRVQRPGRVARRSHLVA